MSELLRINLDNNIGSLNPTEMTNSSEIFIGQQLYEGLFAIDQKGNVILELLENYEVDTASLSYLFFLKKNKKFSNDEPVNANIVVECLNRVPNTPMHDLNVVDEFSFSVQTYSIEQLQFKELAQHDYWIYKTDSVDQLVGSGPFMIEYANSDISYTLKRNPKFQTKKVSNSRINEISIRFIKNPNTLVDEFLNGSIDVLEYQPSQQLNGVLQNELSAKYGAFSKSYQKTATVQFASLHNFADTIIVQKLRTLLRSAWGSRLSYSGTAYQANETDIKQEISVLNQCTFDISRILESVNTSLINNVLIERQSILANPNAQYLVIREAQVDAYGKKPDAAFIQDYFWSKNSYTKNPIVVTFSHAFDQIVYNQRIKNFVEFGDWSKEIQNLNYTEPQSF